MADGPKDGLPPLEWLRTFEAAGRLGSFTAAAETGLTQAAVTQRIKLLEQRIGSTLFKRLPRGVELTVAGDAYLPHITEALARVRRGTADLFARPRSRISVAATPSVTALWIAPRLARLTDTLPGVEVAIASVGREADYDDSGHDYQIRFGLGLWDGFESALLYRETLAPLAAPSLLQAREDWRETPVIAVTGPRDGWREWASATGEAPPGPPGLRFDSQISALEAAVAGAGVALASLPLAAAMLEKGELARASGHTLSMAGGQWLCWRKDRVPAKYHGVIHEALAR